jgi:2-oxoglutarate ferredoxin oxidoreductase subunit gamma
MSKIEVLIAGHGGQGIMMLGDYLAYVAMLQGKHVAHIPSYGPETRGGKAKCYVILSDELVDNPIAEEPDVEIIMNQPSMDFLNNLRQRGLIIYNRSLIETGIGRDDLRVLAIPATEIADGLGDPGKEKTDTKMFANAVMFGAFIEMCMPKVNGDQIKETLKHFLGGKKESLMPPNCRAIEQGRLFVRSNASLNYN